MTTIDSRPNILWTVSEDCPPRFGCYRDSLAATPHLDALAARGALFEHAYCAAPVCALARFALITGVAPESHAPANHMRALAPRPAWMRTYPEIMRELGYYCTNNFKTDYNADIDSAAIWDESSREAHWRNRPSGSPFLAVFNIDGTHESSVFGPVPLAVDPGRIRLPAYLPDTAEIREGFARHYRHIAEMDAAVGKLLSELEDDGLLDNTIIIHCSDHGGVMPRSKRFCYDEGLHVPLIVAAPRRFADLFPRPGTRVEAAVSTIRIPPTLIDLAGGEIPGYMQGQSLARTRFDPAAELAFGARNRMDERYDMIRTVRDARFRYLKNYLPHRPYGQHQAFAWLGAGYQSWQREYLAGHLAEPQARFWQEKPGVELYDTVADPDEVHNLAGQQRYAEIEQRLERSLHEHMLAVHDNGFLPEGSPAEGYEASREPGRYPLADLLDLADAVIKRDPDKLPRFIDALTNSEATIRRWSAIGILALGPAGVAAADELRTLLHTEPDPFVIIPCSEALARWSADAASAGRLAEFAEPLYPRPVRLEALNALAALDPNSLLPYRDHIEVAAQDPDQYVGEAGRYLLLQIDGKYTPEALIFSWENLVIPAEYRTPAQPGGKVGG
jgi:arylsulfatase A-like enzyme